MDTTPSTPTISPSSPSSGGTSSSESLPSGTGEHNPPRRRLVNAASFSLMKLRYQDELTPRTNAKRENVAVVTGPPGFNFDRSAVSQSLPSPGSPASSPVTASPSSPSMNVSFRDRGGRPPLKGDLQSDYPMSSHGHGGNSGPSKAARTTFAANVAEARPLGRRPEVRRHEAPNTQKHSEDVRIQQVKRAALVRAQTMSAPGNYRSFDSQFGNYLVPVIPNQFFNKSPSTVQFSTAQSSQVSHGR